MKLLIATRNPGKFNEIKDFLQNQVSEFYSLDDFEVNDDFEENGSTFCENALIKANHYYKQVQIPVLADDSGIFVQALQDQLGVKTRRWGAGKDASDQEWINHFLQVMEPFQGPERQAEFVSAIALVSPKGTHCFEGRVDGQLSTKLEAEILPGIPLSSCFIPTGETKVYAALSIEKKNQVSHRARALTQLKEFLSHHE